MHTVNSWPTKDGLRIGFLNICSIRNKLDELSSILDNNGKQFHVFCCGESRLTDKISDEQISITGYNHVRIDPTFKLQTGLILYITQSVRYKRVLLLESYDVEAIWIEVIIKKSRPILIGFIYRNPDEPEDWLDRFSNMMDAATLSEHETFILGDFNIDLIKGNKTWNNLYQNYDLTQLIDIPTRTRQSSETLIDHIYVNSLQNITEVCAPLSGCSDHSPICLTWNKKGSKIPKPGHKVITYRSYTNFDENSFLQDLAKSPLSNVYQYTDPDKAFEFWYNVFVNVYDNHAPLLTKRVKHTIKPPWLTNDIKQETCLRDKLLKDVRHLKQKSQTDTQIRTSQDKINEQLLITEKFDEFRAQRNKITSMLRHAKKDYFRNLISNSTRNDSKKIWKAINILTKKTSNQPSILENNITPNDLNQHFANIANATIKTDLSKHNDLNELIKFCDSKHITAKADIPFITVNEVYYYLTHLKQTNTRGLDNLNGKILKLSASIISDTLTYLYNLCIANSYYPKLLKQAKIIPVFKSGEKDNPSNYRPISIVSVLSKPLEKHISKHLEAHTSKYDLLHQNQSGFRRNHSCHTALVNLTDHWLTNINVNRITGAIFVDFAKAFDVLDHKLLLRKLAVYGLTESSVYLIKSFLTNRMHSVNYNNKASDFVEQKFGVPQGSVLGPLLFLLYINDLPLHIDGMCELFADDTSIHSSHSDITQLNSSLQNSVNQLTKWTELNHMALNEQKTKHMVITTRQKRQNLPTVMPSIYIGGNCLQEVHYHKLLGVTIDNNLTWSNHINNLCKVVSQKVFQLSKIKHFLDKDSRKCFYYAHIQSHIDYASSLFDSCKSTVMKPLTRIHKRAVKAILLKSSTLLPHDYKSLNILPLSQKLKHNKAVLMYRVHHDLVPQTLSARFKENPSRYSQNLIVPKPRIDLFKTSLIYSGGSLWNSLPKTVKEKKSLKSFKEAFKLYLLKSLEEII